MLQLFSIFTIFTLIVLLSFSEVNGELTVHDDDYIIEKFATGIDFPTTMDFIGDDLLVLEKNTGKIIRINENGEKNEEPLLIDVLDSSKTNPLDESKSSRSAYVPSVSIPVSGDGESGLLGIATTTDNVFLYFTESGPPYDVHQGAKNVVYQYDWTGKKLINPILIKELPAIGDTHNGGVFAKGENKEIYFVIGDNEHVSDFQNFPSKITRETSSIFKINTDDDNRVELFAMGIRNSFGLAVDPITGHLWQTENGVTEYDEINLVKPGFNSGWRILMGPADRDWLWDIDINSDRIFSTNIENDEAIYHIIPQSFNNFIYSDPEFSWFTPIGVTSIAFPEINTFSKYRNWLFVGDFNHGKIYKFQLNSDRTNFIFSNQALKDLVLDTKDIENYPEITNELVFAEFPGGITDIKFAHGAMYVVVPFADGYEKNSGAIYKIYLKESTLPPLKQYDAGVLDHEITCKPGLISILKNSGYIVCVFPETASILINRTGFSETSLTETDLINFIVTETDLTGTILTGVDLSGKDLTGTILTGVDLSGKDLTGTILNGADLTGTILTGVDLSGKDLTGTILNGADLTNAILTGVDLSKKDLRNVNLTNVDLSGLNLRDAIIIGVDLSGKDLTRTDLANTVLTLEDLVSPLKYVNCCSYNISNANLTGVDLSGRDLSNVFFSDVDLSNKDLTGTDLTDVNLTRMDLSNTVLRYANLTNANLTGVDLSGKDLTGTILTGANLNTDLAGVDLSGKDLTGANLAGVDLSGKDLTGTILTRTILTGANLTGVDLSGKDLTNANLTRTDLTGANLAGTNLTRTILTNAILTNANLTGVDLSGKDLTGTILTNANLHNVILSCFNHEICSP